MTKTQDSDGRMDKSKIAKLNIDSILNLIIVSLRNMKVLNFASSKWVYVLKMKNEKWLRKTRKYKTMVGGAILNYSSILKLLLQYFFFF
jgi:hypothetical protein